MLKQFAKAVRQYKTASLLSPLFMLGEVFLEVLIPYYMRNIMDFGIDKSDMNYVTKTSAVLVVFALLSLTCGALSGTFAARAATGFAANLRHDIFRRIQTFSFSNIDKFSTAGLVTRLTTDVSNVQMAYQAIIRQAVRALLMFSFAMTMSFRLNAQVSLVFLAVSPILGFGLFFVIFKVHPIFVRAFGAYDKLNRVVQENLHGIRVVKSFVREEKETEKFTAFSGEIYDDFVRAQKRVAFNTPLLQLCLYGSTLLIAWFGARLIVSDKMSVGELTGIITYTMQILMSLMLLSFVFIMIIISRTSAKRIGEVLCETSDLQNPAEPIRSVADGAIALENVSFSYVNDADKLCLRSINLKIASGETIGIIGGTGSAKTTLVNLIPRLYDATQGTVRVGGRDVREYDMETLRREVAVVLQNNILFSGTIRENLRWGNENATDEELREACRLAQADGFIERFSDGYDTYIEQGGSNVSGGQKQRLCIARALLKNPKILILDDSTSAVDTATDAGIRRAFAQSLPHTTKLIIAQRVLSVLDADRIIVMENGSIHAIGTHEELLAQNKIYREVYQSQMQSGGDFDVPA